MAIYQFIFNLDTSMCESEEAEIILSSKKLKLLAELLPPSKSWSEELLLYGGEDESCVEFFLGQSKVIDITVKLDLRNLTSNLISAISEFSYDNNLCIIYKGRRYEPTKKTLITLIKQSRAYKFVKDPEKFLKNLN